MNNLIAFQQKLTTTGTAQNLPSNPVRKAVTITTPSTNSAAIVFGNTSSVTPTSGFILDKGESVPIELASGNTDALWAVGTANDVFSVVGD